MTWSLWAFGELYKIRVSWAPLQYTWLQSAGVRPENLYFLKVPQGSENTLRVVYNLDQLHFLSYFLKIYHTEKWQVSYFFLHRFFSYMSSCLRFNDYRSQISVSLQGGTVRLGGLPEPAFQDLFPRALSTVHSCRALQVLWGLLNREAYATLCLYGEKNSFRWSHTSGYHFLFRYRHPANLVEFVERRELASPRLPPISGLTVYWVTVTMQIIYFR